MSEEQIRKEFETWVMENCRRSGQHLQRSSSGLYMDNRVASKWTSYFAAASSSQDRIAQLEAELFEARKDQERYHFVRDMTPEQFENTSTIHEDFDRQIDAMIKEQQ